MISSASSRVKARSVSVSSAPWRPSFVMISSAVSSSGASKTSTTSYWPSVTHTPTSFPPASSIVRSPSSTRSRKADELIKAGRVLVNGEPGQLHTVVQSKDKVEVDGQTIAKERLTHLLLHKPADVVSTVSDPQGRKTVVELVPKEPHVVPVGRL